MDLEIAKQFFGWCLVINAVILVLTTVALVVLGGWAAKFHAKMFDLDEKDVRQSYFQYLARLKICVIIFNLAPWLALVLMSK